MATETTIRQVFAVLATEYPDQTNKLAEEQVAGKITLFVQALADIEDETLKAAALRHVATSPWFPKVSELRASAAAIAREPAIDPVEAWGQVRRMMMRYGSYGEPYHDEATNTWGYRSPSFDDPLITQIVKQMGWRDLCLSDENTAMSDRARFIDAYTRLAQRQRQQDTLPAGLRDGAMSRRQLAPGRLNAIACVQALAVSSIGCAGDMDDQG